MLFMRKNRTEIWCGLSREFHFVKIDELKNTAIKIYRTKKQARKQDVLLGIGF